MVLVVYTGLTEDSPIHCESPPSFLYPISFFSRAAFVLPIPLSSINAELNMLRGPNCCVLFLQQFEMITQLWCLSVTSCDDRHCNRAEEIVFFHFGTPHYWIASLSTTATVIPLLVSFSNWRDGGCMFIFRPPAARPPSARHPPLPIAPAAWRTSTPSRWGREPNMTGLSHWRRKPAGVADTHTHKHTQKTACVWAHSHIVYIGRYRDSISCQIEMGIKEEAGNYLCALSKRFVTDRRCDERTGLRGVDDTVIRICHSDWKEERTVQEVCFERG